MAIILYDEEIEESELGQVQINREQYPSDDDVYTLEGIKANSLEPGEYNLVNCEFDSIGEDVVIHECDNSKIGEMTDNAMIESVVNQSVISHMRDESYIDSIENSKVEYMHDDTKVFEVGEGAELEHPDLDNAEWGVEATEMQDIDMDSMDDTDISESLIEANANDFEEDDDGYSSDYDPVD